MASNLKHIGIKGSGYFCDVYQFLDESTNEFVAAKRLKKNHFENDDYRYRLIREIKLLKSLKDCPEIIDLLKDGNNREKQSLWYLMPYAEYNLYKYIKKNAQKISIETKFKFTEQIISAIKYAHDKDILHRDISPNNVLVFESEGELNVKVSDFGLGKDQESLSHYTGSSSDSYGHILYVSPEQRAKLKDATFQSDIYSLGKLIYFIFTAKDPDNLKQCPLSPLIAKATEEEAVKRYSNMSELEKHFLALKKLQFEQKIPIEYVSVMDFVESKEAIDWNLFHKIVLNGKISNHVYLDFLSPIISLFTDKKKLIEYSETIGADFKSFVQCFSDNVYECLGSNGWPFKATDSFGALLKEIVLIATDSEIRLICLKLMWHLAFVCDQWAVQSDIKPLLNAKFVTDDIEISFAEHIQSNPIEIHLSNFNSSNLTPIVKKSITLANEAHKKQETLKDIDSDSWDF